MGGCSVLLRLAERIARATACCGKSRSGASDGRSQGSQSHQSQSVHKTPESHYSPSYRYLRRYGPLPKRVYIRIRRRRLDMGRRRAAIRQAILCDMWYEEGRKLVQGSAVAEWPLPVQLVRVSYHRYSKLMPIHVHGRLTRPRLYSLSFRKYGVAIPYKGTLDDSSKRPEKRDGTPMEGPTIKKLKVSLTRPDCPEIQQD